jgi:hypothetical protein
MRHRSAAFEMPGGSGTFSRKREKVGRRAIDKGSTGMV